MHDFIKVFVTHSFDFIVFIVFLFFDLVFLATILGGVGWGLIHTISILSPYYIKIEKKRGNK